jgi:hypothetical protein
MEMPQAMIEPLPHLRRRYKNARLPHFFVSASVVALSALAGCSVVKTTANVAGTAVVTTAKVAGTAASTTVDVAKATATTGAVVGSAAVASASAAKSVTLATTSVAISGASLVGNAVMWGIAMQKQDEYHAAPVVSAGGGRFVSAEGKTLTTAGCDDVPAQAPATLVYTKSGETQVRVNGAACEVKTVAP